MGSTWVNALLAVISLGTGVAFLVAAGRRPAEHLGCVAHALMGFGMAGMFSPWGDPVPPVAGAVVFTVVAAWFGAKLLRNGRLGLTESTHLVVGPAAMVFMYLGPMNHASMDAATTMVDPAHAGHTMTMGGGGGSPWLSALALGLMGYFVWYAWILAGRLRGPAGPGGGSVAVTTRTLTRVVVGAHVVMCVLMAVMFLGSV